MAEFDDSDLLDTFSLEALEAAVAFKREECVDLAVKALDALNEADALSAIKKCKHLLITSTTRRSAEPAAVPTPAAPRGKAPKRSGGGPGRML